MSTTDRVEIFGGMVECFEHPLTHFRLKRGKFENAFFVQLNNGIDGAVAEIGIRHQTI